MLPVLPTVIAGPKSAVDCAQEHNNDKLNNNSNIFLIPNLFPN